MMGSDFCFANFEKILQLAMKPPYDQQFALSEHLLTCVIPNGSYFYEYYNESQISDLCRRIRNIDKKIQYNCEKKDVVEYVHKYFEENVIKFISQNRKDKLIEDMQRLILEDTTWLAKVTKKHFLKMATVENISKFLSSIFIYSVTIPNKKPKDKIFISSDGIENKELNDTDDISYKSGIKVLRRKDSNVNLFNLLSKATSEIFISGISLGILNKIYPVLRDCTSKQVSIRLLKFDENYPQYIKAFEKVCGVDSKDLESTKTETGNNTCISDVLKSTNVELREIDGIIPVAFIAIDLHTKHGCIIIQHFLNNISEPILPQIVIRPKDTSWYTAYSTQIRILWDKSEILDCQSRR